MKRENTNNSNQNEGNHGNTNETAKGSKDVATVRIEINKNKTQLPAGTGVKNSNVEDCFTREKDGGENGGDSSGNGNNSNTPNPKNK